MNELIKALLNAEKSFTKIELNKTAKIGANFTFKYADLSSLFNSTKKALRENGLKVIGTMEVDEMGTNILSMHLYHVSGEKISSSMRLPKDVSKSTELGAIITYMRRYLYATLLGIVADEDTDGDAITESEKKTEPREPKGGHQREPIPLTDQQKDWVLKVWKKAGFTQDDFSNYFGESGVDGMLQSQLTRFNSFIKEKK